MKLSPDVVARFSRDVREFVDASTDRRRTTDATREFAADINAADSTDVELATALEELQVAEEELRVQTDELLIVGEALEQERLRYLDLFEHAPDAYLVTDARGVIRQANAASARLLGIRQDFIVGKPIGIYLDEMSRRRVRRLMEDGRSRDRVVDWYLQLNPRRRAPVHAAVSIAAVHAADGAVEEYRWLVRELPLGSEDPAERARIDAEVEQRTASRTAALEADRLRLVRLLEQEQVAREAAESASRAKSEFLAVLSHELRTPLQALVGYTEILETGVHGAMNAAQAEDVRRMHRSEQHLLRIVNSVLEFVKLESGFFGELESRAFEIPDVLRGLHTLIAPQLDAKRLIFVSRYEDPLPPAYADPGQVQQIVLNLLSNAVKFTPPGGVIAVETAGIAGSVLIRVRDTGVGIAPELLDSVFEPFVQAHGATSSETRGTGLGLAIARRLAEAMGGSLVAESEQGAGSTFTLSLPAAAVPT